MHLAVVVVSYNTRDLLAACLHSVYASPLPTGARLSVVVVDNASADGSAAMVAQDYSQTRLIASIANLGFTGGNNLALHALGFDVTPPPTAPPVEVAAACPDAVLLFNPDAELTGDALAQMAVFLAATPAAGICGARLRYGDGSFQHGAFRFPGLAQIVLDLFPLTGVRGSHRLHDSRLNGRYPAARWDGGAPFPVDFVLGAALCIRREVIERIGGLDDGYFMYCEEMDWCLCCRQAGWQVYALPTAHVVHHAGQSSRQVRWDAYERLWRSRIRFFDKHRAAYPPGYPTLLRGLIRAAAAWRSRQARRRFAAGTTTGDELARELAAYATLTRL